MKKNMKKRILRSTVGLVFLAALTLPACEFLQECGYCELVTDDNGDITTSTPIPLCGDKLAEKKDSSPTTIGNTTTYYNCY